MRDEPFRWGLIAPGRIAHTFAKALEAVAAGTLHAVASRNMDRARAFARQYGAIESYDVNSDLVNDPDVDAIYIASPHRFHAEQCRLALEAGKPVLCEKPLAVNAGEARELFTLAREHDTFLMEALWTRALPLYDKIRSWMSDGVIGEAHLLQSTFGFAFPRELQGRVFNHDLAGGALLDIGIYNVAVSQWVAESFPVEISAIGMVGGTGVDEWVSANLRYSPTFVSQFTCSLLSRMANTFSVYGTDGSISIDANFWGGTRATLNREGHTTIAEAPFDANGFEYEIREAQRCIREGLIASPVIPPGVTLENLRILDLLRQKIGLQYRFE